MLHFFCRATNNWYWFYSLFSANTINLINHQTLSIRLYYYYSASVILPLASIFGSKSILIKESCRLSDDPIKAYFCKSSDWFKSSFSSSSSSEYESYFFIFWLWKQQILSHPVIRLSGGQKTEITGRSQTIYWSNLEKIVRMSLPL